MIWRNVVIAGVVGGLLIAGLEVSGPTLRWVLVVIALIIVVTRLVLVVVMSRRVRNRS